jgi:hypothetical protein
LDQLLPVAAEITLREVVAEDEDDVGLIRSEERGAGEGEEMAIWQESGLPRLRS